LLVISERRESTIRCCSTLTTDLCSRGQKKAAETRCAPILRTLSHSTPRQSGKCTVSRCKPAEFFSHFHRVQKLPLVVKPTLKWCLMDQKPLPTWVHPKGRLVFFGDACHPMLVRMLPCGSGGMLTLVLSRPYRAQGAAIAVEDPAVLGAFYTPNTPTSYTQTKNRLPRAG
jgi:hypothetical protein